MTLTTLTTLTLTIAPAQPEDASRGIVRLDPADLARIGGATGAVLALTGTRTAHARALPLPPSFRGQSLIQADANLRANAGAGVGDPVAAALSPALPDARAIRLSCPHGLSAAALRAALQGVPVADGTVFRLPLVDGAEAECRIEQVQPHSPAMAGPHTTLTLAAAAPPPGDAKDRVRWEDLGGLGPIVAQVREVLEWPLRQPEAFSRLGIVPPKGVLLAGPPGTGKTMIARAVATETRAHFLPVAAPEIMDKHYGASEQQLRELFETASARAPAVIFIDEIDAIAPKREALSGEKQVERRVVAQLLALMDGLSGRGQVLVLAATNIPDALDPALRRPGRFDREITVPPPDRAGRAEILAVHTRAMPLAPDVSLPALAALTHGYVGADIAALCREAAITCLRRAGLGRAPLAPAEIAALEVAGADFSAALAAITPSALREAAAEIADARWEDIAGLDAVRAALERAVLLPLRNPALFARLQLRPPRGVLLAGPPGTGKTLIARALAGSGAAGFISVRGAELLTEWQGASERALRDLFRRARLAAPCILFFDEIDAIAGRRGGADGATVERMVAQLLTEMDGVADPAGVVVLGATNRPDRIDPALLRPGRFDIVLELGLPDGAARASMLRLHAGRLPLAPGLESGRLAQDLAAATAGFSGAGIAGLCRRAALAAIARHCAANPGATASADEAAPIVVTQADFASALAAMPPAGAPAQTLPQEAA